MRLAPRCQYDKICEYEDTEQTAVSVGKGKEILTVYDEDKDYIMRLTHENRADADRLLFQKTLDRVLEAAISAEMAVRYRELLAMIRDGQINEAENLLLDEMEPDNPAWFENGSFVL